MTYGAGIMFAVAGLLALAGGVLLIRLRAPQITEKQTYAFRLAGIMLLSAGIVLAFSAAALQRWSVTP